MRLWFCFREGDKHYAGLGLSNSMAAWTGGRHRRRKCGNLEGFSFASFSFLVLFLFVSSSFRLDVCDCAFVWLDAYLCLGIAVWNITLLWFEG